MQYKFDATSITSRFDESQKLEIAISRDESQVEGSVELSIKQPSSKAGFKEGFNRTPKFNFKPGQEQVIFKPGQILKVNPSKKIKLEMTLQNPDADIGTATVSSKKLTLTLVPASKKAATKPSPTSVKPTPTTTTGSTPIPTPLPVGSSPSPSVKPSPKPQSPVPVPSTPAPSAPVPTAADIARLEKMIAQTQGSLNTMQGTLKTSLGDVQSGIKNIQVLEKQQINLEQDQQKMMIEDNTEVNSGMDQLNATMNQLLQMMAQQQAGVQQPTHQAGGPRVAGNTGITGGMHINAGAGAQAATQPHTQPQHVNTPLPIGTQVVMPGSTGAIAPTTKPQYVCGQFTTYIPVVEYEQPTDMKICKREFDHLCSLNNVTAKVENGITRLTFPPGVPQPPAPGTVGTLPTSTTTPTVPSNNPTAPPGTKQPSIPSYYGQIHIPGKPDPQWAYIPNKPITGTLMTCPAPMQPEAVFDPITNEVVQACVLRSTATSTTPNPTSSAWKPVTKYLNDWSGDVQYRFRNGDLELRGQATAPTASTKAKANPNATAPIFWIMDAEITPMIPSVMKVADGGGSYSGVGLWWTVFSPAKDGVAQESATGANGLVVSAAAASIALAPISFTGVELAI